MVVPTFDFALAASSEEERFFFAAASYCSQVVICSGGSMESNVMVGIRLAVGRSEVLEEDMLVVTRVLVTVMVIRRWIEHVRTGMTVMR